MTIRDADYSKSMRVFADYMYEYGRFLAAIGKLETNPNFLPPKDSQWEKVGASLKSKLSEKDMRSAIVAMDTLRQLSPFIFASSKMTGTQKKQLGAQVEKIASHLQSLFP